MCKKSSLQIDIDKDLIRLRKQRKQDRKIKLLNGKNITNIAKMKINEDNLNENDYTNMMIKYDIDNIDKELKRYRGEGIVINSVVYFNYSVKSRSNAMKKELEYLNQRECEIIMKLRFEYINLNHYLHHVHYHPDGNCDHCGVPETVSHFLLDCKGFHDSPLLSLHKDNTDFVLARQQMRKRLRDIAIFFKYPINFNVQNILFPHLWQGEPKKGKDYKRMKKNYLDTRVAILKTVINFVNRTKRFKNDFGL